MKENVTMQIIRSSILGILWSIALILLCGEPIEDETWFRVFFMTKGACVPCGIYRIQIICTMGIKRLIARYGR